MPVAARLFIAVVLVCGITFLTYSVLHGRDGSPERALLVCDLPGGGRAYALLDGGPDVLARAEAEELVGRTVTLTPKDRVNLARPV